MEAYADGCYRRTDDGDLPLHLLVRSGSATQVTVELLLRPIINNPTICAYPGSVGVNLPLHIAAEYRCKYDILEGLLSSYSGAALLKRQLLQQPEAASKKDSGEGGGEQGRTKKDTRAPQYALEIFEEGRGKDGASLVESTVGGGAAAKGSASNIVSKGSRVALGEAE